MARFSKSLEYPEQDYPALWGIVMKVLWRLPADEAKVFRAFVKSSELSVGDAVMALMPGSYPEIALDTLRPSKYATFRGGNVIYLNKLFAAQADQAAQLGVANVRLLVESKILHEMVHWGYYRTHLEFDPPPERGWEFEQAAYGKTLTITSLGIDREFLDLPGGL